jgi:3-deoxy-D-manno-octulosonic-acid transferase
LLKQARRLGSIAHGKYNRIVYAAYSLLLMLALVLSGPWWLWQMLRHGKYRAGWGERLGHVPNRILDPAAINTIWIHAVSVGEVLAISQVVAELQKQLPDSRIVVSTTTDTGQKLARQRFGENKVFYAPLDLPWAERAYLDALHPRMLVLAESEFWPNLLHSARRAGVAVAVVNARVSDRSLPRYLRCRGLLAHVMKNVHLFVAQTEEDARRLVAIGAPAEQVHVGGNLKFEVKPPVRTAIAGLIAAAIQRDNIGPLIVAGSTLEGEEAMLLDAFRAARERYAETTLLLAPRHPERFDAVAALLAASGIRFHRRSQWKGDARMVGGVLLLDTIGELASLYEFADLAFIGGSLVPRGGHNVLEAAYFGVPILVGPYTENFRDIVETFGHADALRVTSPDSFTQTVLALLENYDERERLGRNAKDVMRAQQGATQRTVAALLDLLPRSAMSRSPEFATERQV